MVGQGGVEGSYGAEQGRSERGRGGGGGGDARGKATIITIMKMC